MKAPAQLALSPRGVTNFRPGQATEAQRSADQRTKRQDLLSMLQTVKHPLSFSIKIHIF